MSATMNSPHMDWQGLIRQRLEERDAREKAHDEMIENYQRLFRHAKLLRERNISMLEASQGFAAASATGPTVGSSKATATAGVASKDQDGTAVKLAYLASLESQLRTAQEELSGLYKTQSQNAQKLVSLNEQIRGKDDREREASEEIRRLNDEMTRVKRQEEDLRGVVGEKDKMIQMLQDELSALSLELNQVELRNDNLKRDNASLLQRWLDRMNDEAERMNEGNRFLQEVEQRKVSQDEKATGE